MAKRGTTIMPLAQALATYCAHPLGGAVPKYPGRDATKVADPRAAGVAGSKVGSNLGGFAVEVGAQRFVGGMTAHGLVIGRSAGAGGFPASRGTSRVLRVTNRPSEARIGLLRS